MAMLNVQWPRWANFFWRYSIGGSKLQYNNCCGALAPEADDIECKEVGPLPTSMSCLWGFRMRASIVVPVVGVYIVLGDKGGEPLNVPPIHIRIRENKKYNH
jgi:hypothetical protein